MVELMLVVAIIGVLAAVAVPVYRDYNVRARLAEVVLATTPCRNIISETVQAATEADLSDKLRGSCSVNPSQYVAAGTVDVASDGVISIVVETRGLGGGLPDGSAMSMTPITSTGALLAPAAGGARILSWRCAPAGTTSRTGIPLRLLPAGCKA